MIGLVLFSVLLALLAFSLWVVLTPRDVDPTLLVHQGSLSRVRKPYESAVYRSNVNEHGRPLLGAGMLGNFQLRDVWESETINVASVASDGSLVTTEDVVSRVERYGPALQALCPGPENAKVLVALETGPAALCVLFACVLYDLEPFLVGSTNPEVVQAALDLIKPGVVVSSAAIGELKLGDALPVSIGAGSDKVMSMDDFRTREVPQSSTGPPVSPVAFTLVTSASSPDGSETLELKPITHAEIGLAVVSQMRALEDTRWLPSDKVLFFARDVSPYLLLMQFTALSCKSQLVFVSPGFLEPFKVLATSAPSVVVTDDLTMRSVVRHADDFTPWDTARLAVARIWLHKGTLPHGIMPAFASVRLIHTATVAGERFGRITTAEANDARSLTGAQVIRTLVVPELFMPIAQTKTGDYRAGDGKTINFGPVVPGIEAKVLGPDAEKSHGKLSVRNTSEWVRTDTDATLKGDGCLYLAVPAAVEHDVFYG